MASLVVYVHGDRLALLIADDARDSGRSWLVRKVDLPEPQLEFLDADGTLYVVTVEDGRAVIVGIVDDPEIDAASFGDALLRDHDITELLPRLGCAAVADVATWAKIPRILPPTDEDFLRFTLGLTADLVRPPAPPDTLAPTDARMESLRADVFAHPESDEARTIYADYLQTLGDPRGELIALQLERARRHSAVTDRERALVGRFAVACAAPLAPYLHWFELSRGFVRTCTVSYDAPVPAAICADPAWSTVESIAATDVDLLCSPYLRAPRASIGGNVLERLLAGTSPLPFEVIIGLVDRDRQRPHYGSHRGVELHNRRAWAALMETALLPKLRVLGIDYASLAQTYLAAFLRSSTCKRLDQLDLWIDLGVTATTPFRPAFDDASVPVMTIRFTLLPTVPTQQVVAVVIALERTRREPLLRVQLDHPVSGEQLTAVLRAIAPLGRGLPRIEVNDLSDPTQVSRHALLIDRLGTMFTRVNARPGDSMAP